MPVLDELQENLDSMHTARFVTTMLRDISANKLQELRADFEKNSLFYKEMRELDVLVQAYAAKRNREREKRVYRGTIFVALTSNKRFFGTLNRDIMLRFMDRLKQDENIEGVVIGQTGKTMLEETPFESRTSYFEFADDAPTSDEIFALMKSLQDYEQVFLFYPTYINPFRQEVSMIDITYAPTVQQGLDDTVDYIFEPDIENLLEFFETQVRLILFNRVLIETKLAQTGARLAKMQRAREEAGERIKEARQEIHKTMMSIQNMRLLESFAGFGK